MTVSALREIKEWAEDALRDVQLQRPADGERLDQYELVTPAVHIGWVPPGSIIPSGSGDRIRVPCVVVGADEVDADEESTEIQLMFTAVVFDPGHQVRGENGSLGWAANFDGYVNLLNLLDRLRARILRDRRIAGKYRVASTVVLKTYEEQPWPYWYGYLKLTATCEPYPASGYAKFLE